jgi:hypothetical protein
VALGGDGLWSNLIAQKAFVAAFALGAALLVVLAARSVAPERAVPAAVLTLWSPLLLWEMAGNGHNDSVDGVLPRRALLRRGETGSASAAAAAVLSALVIHHRAAASRRPRLVAPARRARRTLLGVSPSRRVHDCGSRALAAGSDTVAALRRPGMTFILSLATLAHGWLAGRLGDADASALVRAVSGLLFLPAYGWLLARSGGDARELAARWLLRRAVSLPAACVVVVLALVRPLPAPSRRRSARWSAQ